MRKQTITSEISAELLLNLLYPDQQDQWVVRNQGTFYRNYSADVLAVDEELHEVELSRDGFLKLLPQGVLALDGDLKGSNFPDRYEETARRQQLLHEAFVPVDTFAFRRRLQVERKVSELLQQRLDYVLATFFHYDRASEPNRFVRQLAVTLPFISDFRANFGLLRALLQSIVGCEVTMSRGRYSDEDNIRQWLPWLRYTLYIDHLSPEDYRQLLPEVAGLEAFVQEWFVPFNMKCTLSIRQHPQTITADTPLTLDYNTQLS